MENRPHVLASRAAMIVCALAVAAYAPSAPAQQAPPSEDSAGETRTGEASEAAEEDEAEHDEAGDAEASEEVVSTSGTDTVTTTSERVDGVMEGRARRIERIDSEEMQRRGVTTLAEALAATSAGSQITPTGQTAGLVVDGLPASQVTVLRDGLPLAAAAGSPQGPIVDLSAIAIAPDTIERIDIYRGVGPVGSGGAGGVVIDIISKNAPKNSSIGASAQLLGGPGDRLGRAGAALLSQRYTLEGLAALGKHFNAQASAQYASRGALDVDRDQVTDRPARDLLAGDVGLTWRPRTNDFLRLQLLANHSDSEVFGAPGGVFDNLVRRTVARARLKGRWWLGRDVRLDHHTDVGRNVHTFHKRVRSSGIERLKADTTLDVLNQSLSATWFTAEHDLVLEGAGRVWSVERIGETGELPRVREARGGIGLADTWYASSDLEIFGRLFATGATDFGGALNAQTSAAWGASDRLTLRASLSRSQRTPSPEELYLFFDHTEVGYQITGNPDLRPEDLYSAQLGGVWTSADQRLGVEVMAFHHYIDDVIVTVATEDSSNLFTYRNLGRGQTAGLQLQLQGHDLPWGMAMLANYTFMPLARTLPGGEPLPNRSAHSARAELRRRWGRGRVETWVDVTARSAMSTPEGTPNAPAFALVGAGASWKTSFGMQLMLDINNILDQTHPTWGPMPGFHALLGVRVGHDFGAGSGAGSARAEADD